MNSMCRRGTNAQEQALAQAGAFAALVDFLPTQIADSGNILLVAAAPYVPVIAALPSPMIWLQIIVTQTAAGANVINIAQGAAGFEVLIDDYTATAVAPLGLTMFNGPFYLPAGTRLAMQCTLVNTDVEVHAFCQ